MGKYIQPSRLREIVARDQQHATLSEEFCGVVQRMVWEIGKKYSWGSDFEEVRQEVFIILVRQLPNLDPKRNLFAYLSTVIINVFKQTARNSSRRTKAFQNYITFQKHRNPYLETK